MISWNTWKKCLLRVNRIIYSAWFQSHGQRSKKSANESGQHLITPRYWKPRKINPSYQYEFPELDFIYCVHDLGLTSVEKIWNIIKGKMISIIKLLNYSVVTSSLLSHQVNVQYFPTKHIRGSSSYFYSKIQEGQAQYS